MDNLPELRLQPGVRAARQPRPTCSAGDLQALTAALNSSLPDDVHQVLATHNGQRAGHRILFGLILMSADDITKASPASWNARGLCR